MTATADRLLIERAINSAIEDRFPIKTSVTVFVGCFVNFVNATGRITDGVAGTTAANSCAGVLVDYLNDSGTVISTITGNADGTVFGVVRWNHECLMNVKTNVRTYTSLNKTCFVYQNDTVGGATAGGTAAVRVAAGRLAQFADSTKATAYVVIRTAGDASLAGA